MAALLTLLNIEFSSGEILHLVSSPVIGLTVVEISSLFLPPNLPPPLVNGVVSSGGLTGIFCPPILLRLFVFLLIYCLEV